MVRTRDKHGSKQVQPAGDEWLDDGSWLLPLPQPETREGGESTWALWHEAEREMQEAFAQTQPSNEVPLGHAPETGPPPWTERAEDPARSAAAMMVLARRNNRVCPQASLWMQLYRLLGGERYADLPPPPVADWGRMSALQKRLRFREHVEWAERHGKLPEMARFVEGLAESDWLHMADN